MEQPVPAIQLPKKIWIKNAIAFPKKIGMNVFDYFFVMYSMLTLLVTLWGKDPSNFLYMTGLILFFSVVERQSNKPTSNGKQNH